MARRASLIGVAAFAAMALISAVAWADAPATQPISNQTPQKFLETMTNDTAAAMSPEEVTKTMAYDPTVAEQQKAATIFANLIIEESKLEIAVRKKWGKDAEAAVAHALSDFVVADLPTLTWDITGDKASGKFRQPGLIPMLFIRVDGNWKIDVAAYAMFSHEDFAQFAKDIQDAVDITRKLSADLADSKDYPTAEKFEQHVSSALAPPESPSPK